MKATDSPICGENARRPRENGRRSAARGLDEKLIAKAADASEGRKTVDLKSCPFCGSNDIFLSRELENVGVVVFCKTCFADVGCYDTVDEAVAAWNRRVLNVGQGDCVRCLHDHDTSCKFYGEPDGCNNRMLAELARKVAEK